jgi:hypothetical protein
MTALLKVFTNSFKLADASSTQIAWRHVTLSFAL